MTPQTTDRRVMTIDEVAQELRLAKRTVQRLAGEGVIPGVRIGKCYRFDARKIEELFDVKV